jgi:ATP-dependent Zn protease
MSVDGLACGGQRHAYIDAMDEREKTAIHEAGHAVMCLRLGVVLGAISIIPNENGRLGFVTHEDDSEFTADGAKNKALTCLAGYAALVAIDAPNAASGCDDDFDDAQEALERWQLGSVDGWKGRTIEMMRRPENVKAVGLVASKLLAMAASTNSMWTFL